jgi:hypothetical protein
VEQEKKLLLTFANFDFTKPEKQNYVI